MADGINTAINTARATYMGSRRGSNGVAKPHFKLAATGTGKKRNDYNASRRKSMGGKGG